MWGLVGASCALMCVSLMLFETLRREWLSLIRLLEENFSDRCIVRLGQAQDSRTRRRWPNLRACRNVLFKALPKRSQVVQRKKTMTEPRFPGACVFCPRRASVRTRCLSLS